MRLLRKILVLFVLLGGMLALGKSNPAPPAPPPFRVVVNAKNPLTGVDRKFLTEVFLKKTTHWGNEEAIRPVDLPAGAAARVQFSNQVLKRSVSAVNSYWQQLIFAGRDVPPPELDGDDDVIRYVIGRVGAIGYVSGSADVSRVKVLVVK